MPLTRAVDARKATFTPGKYTMQLSARAYEGWKFKEQGLPHDLVARCVDGIAPCTLQHVHGQAVVPCRGPPQIASGLWAGPAGVVETQTAGQGCAGQGSRRMAGEPVTHTPPQSCFTATVQ